MTGVKKESKDSLSPTKDNKRGNLMSSNPFGCDDTPKEKENFLLTKSNSTTHIPDSSKSKNSKRVYYNFDKEQAIKMFGYRVSFQRK